MNKHVIIIADKVMGLLKSMTYMALRFSHSEGATSGELSAFLSQWGDSNAATFHEGLVERLLGDLERDGRVARDGDRWRPLVELQAAA